jgi:hypothetical protein
MVNFLRFNDCILTLRAYLVSPFALHSNWDIHFLQWRSNQFGNYFHSEALLFCTMLEFIFFSPYYVAITIHLREARNNFVRSK